MNQMLSKVLDIHSMNIIQKNHITCSKNDLGGLVIIIPNACTRKKCLSVVIANPHRNRYSLEGAYVH